MSLIDLAKELDLTNQMGWIRDWLRTQGHDVADLQVTQDVYGLTLEWTEANTTGTRSRQLTLDALEHLWTYVKIRELQAGGPRS